MRRRGYEPMTPLDSKTPLVAFALQDARTKLADRLKAANIRLTTSQNRFRVSVSVFNDIYFIFMSPICMTRGVLPMLTSGE